MTTDNFKIVESEIAATDQNLSILGMFQQVLSPSLGRQIFTSYEQRGPVAGLFNIRRKPGTQDLELVRRSSVAFPVVPIKTKLTKEAIQDIVSQFGENANEMIGALLRGLANDQENIKTLEFLENHSSVFPALALSEPRNAIIVLREISKTVNEIVLKINSNGYLTYNSVCVLPSKYAAAFMAMNEVTDNLQLYVGKVGLTKYYINPDQTATNAYVCLYQDENASASSGFFSEISEDITLANDPDSGEENYFIFNRFALTASPLHDPVSCPMFYKFGLT